MTDVEINKVYTGTVKKIMEYGAFVNIVPGKDGLVHISQIKNERVENVSDEMSEGDQVKVKVLLFWLSVRVGRALTLTLTFHSAPKAYRPNQQHQTYINL